MAGVGRFVPSWRLGRKYRKVDRHLSSGGVQLWVTPRTSSSVRHGLFGDSMPVCPFAGTGREAGIVKSVRVVRADDRYLA